MSITNIQFMSSEGTDINRKKIEELRELGWRRRWWKEDESKRLNEMKDYRMQRYGLPTINPDDIITIESEKDDAKIDLNVAPRSVVLQLAQEI